MKKKNPPGEYDLAGFIVGAVDLKNVLSGIHVYLCDFFFNDTATTEIYTLSLHDALLISACRAPIRSSTRSPVSESRWPVGSSHRSRDRKSTRLNSSHSSISYAVFCL